MIVAGLVLGTIAALMLKPSPPSAPSPRLIGWWLGDGFLGTPKFDPTTAQTTTVVPISVHWLTCAPQNDSWLEAPAISYTPQFVMITMRSTDAFAGTTTCGGGNDIGTVSVMLDVGIPVAVHLSGPLGGRTLIDGAARPPAVRPYP